MDHGDRIVRPGSSPSDFSQYGRALQNAFPTVATSDFDRLLRRIDEAEQRWTVLPPR